VISLLRYDGHSHVGPRPHSSQRRGGAADGRQWCQRPRGGRSRRTCCCFRRGAVGFDVVGLVHHCRASARGARGGTAKMMAMLQIAAFTMPAAWFAPWWRCLSVGAAAEQLVMTEIFCAPRRRSQQPCRTSEQCEYSLHVREQRLPSEARGWAGCRGMPSCSLALVCSACAAFPSRVCLSRADVHS
jgi:hypothetical protein